MRPNIALRTSRHLHTRRLHRCRTEQLQQSAAPPFALLNRNNVSSDIAKRMIHIQPLPMPAVAHCDFDVYDDIDCYEYGGDDDAVAHQASHVDILASAAAGGNSSGRGPTMIGGNNDDNTTSRFIGGPPNGGGSGGGGHSHHRCPKCGATVTFQDTSKKNNKGMQNNCFYCAACSGWFLVKPNNTNSSTMEMDESKFLLSKMAASAAEANGEKVVGAPPNRKISQPQFVMQHVS
jgi:hypothetical protein